MKNFFDNFACLSEAHCDTCRLQTDEGRAWRESIAKHFSVPSVDFECPHGKPWLKEKPVAPTKSRGLGDTVAKAIHAVSRGKIKPCGGCKKRQAKLNKLVPYKQAAKPEDIEGIEPQT